uniref:Ig-like domain-containing protein n=1 Tax=Capra hircus TaxID=9925 RepID=A0A452EGD5_CAPHI
GATTHFLFNLISTGVRGVYVEQSPPALTPQEGASSTLWCNFSTFADSVWWYLQKPGGRLIHLIYIPSGTRQEGRLNATAVPKERRSSLHISSLWTTDSGTYFCAVWHNAPQAPAASTHTLRRLSPSSSHSHTVRPPQGICSASYWPYRFETLVFIFLSICIFCARFSNV